MRVDRLMAAAFMATVASTAVFAQPRPATPQTTTPAPAASSAAVPATKVALINTEAFADDIPATIALDGFAFVVVAVVHAEIQEFHQRTRDDSRTAPWL